MLFTVDPELCKKDGLCVMACGRRLVEMKDADTVPTPVAEADALCINCGHCVAVCPSEAFSHRDIKPDDILPIRKELHINPDQVEQFLHSRRSVRLYRDKPVERDKLNKLIELAGYAPSGHNARCTRFTIAEGPSTVKMLSGIVIDLMRQWIKNSPDMAAQLHLDRIVGFWENGQDPICRSAPHLIIAHASESEMMGKEDCILALAYLELGAHALGLGATWAGYVMAASQLHPPLVEALNLEEGQKCHGIMMVGHPKVKFKRLPPRSAPPVTWLSLEGEQS
jgi:nitroreductase/NAD-dependent dihydropyrimidine dehydrogenase PreA subunit